MDVKISGHVKSLIAVFTVSLLVGTHVLYKRSEIARLEKIALSPSADTATAKSAVDKLRTFYGSNATDSLLRVATADREFIDGRQDLAIEALATRANPEEIAQLAQLLQPSVGLARREAVTAALKESVCNELCVQSILHYFERYWTKQAQNEDITLLLSGSDPEIQKEEASMAEALGKVLVRNGKATTAVLRGIYGLGGPAPSAFSLHIVEKIHLRSACFLLSTSKHNLLDTSKTKAFETLLSDLQCPSTSESGKD